MGKDGHREQQRFWDMHKNCEWVRAHPSLSAQDNLQDFVPLTLWGDSGQIQGDEKLTLLTFSGVLAHGSTMDHVYVMTGLPGEWCTHDTLLALYKAVSWSFECLTSGVFPTHDHAGRPLSGKRAARAGQSLGGKGVLAFIKGDWSWQAEAYNVNHWAEMEMCHRCTATLNGESVFCKWDGRAWEKRPATYLAQRCPEHPIFLMRGFHQELLVPCSMHVLNLGLMQVMCGTAIWEFIRGKHYGRRNIKDQLHSAWIDFKAWCKQHKVQGNQKNLPGRA